MIVQNVHTKEIIKLPDGAHEVLNAYMVPEQCYYKKDYKRVDVDYKPVDVDEALNE